MAGPLKQVMRRWCSWQQTQRPARERSCSLSPVSLVRCSPSAALLAMRALAVTATMLVHCAGILFGVFLSEVAAVVLFPASATALALRQLRCALNTLAELNKRTWEHSAKDVHETHAAKPGFLAHGQHPK